MQLTASYTEERPIISYKKEKKKKKKNNDNKDQLLTTYYTKIVEISTLHKPV